jgi:hypothetical protein
MARWHGAQCLTTLYAVEQDSARARLVGRSRGGHGQRGGDLTRSCAALSILACPSRARGKCCAEAATRRHAHAR